MAPSARGWQMIEIVSVLVALCLVSVVLRVIARIRRRVGFGVDDYLSVLSMVLMIAMLIELGLCEYFAVSMTDLLLTNSFRVFNWWQWRTYQDLGQRDTRELLQGMHDLIPHLQLPSNHPRSSSPTNSPTSSSPPPSRSPSSASTGESSQPPNSNTSPSA